MSATREQVIAAYPIVPFLEKYGIELVRNGKELKCLCPFHADKNPSMRINPEKSVWFCDPCGFGGSVIDFVIRKHGWSVKEAFAKLAEKANLIGPDFYKPHKTAVYEYKDALGRPVMGVDRIDEGLKKKFSQWHPGPAGERVNGIDGIQRVLYRLERWAGKEQVAVCEGEKCVHALEDLGFDATTNSGGSNGWCDAYSEYLKDKHVDIWPDNDDSGQKWCDAVISSLEGKVASLRVLRLNKPYNDVADLLIAQGKEAALEVVTGIMVSVPRIESGVIIPLLSADECLELYRKRVKEEHQYSVDLGKWLPSMRHCARPLQAGDMGVVLADTGVGKTGILVNIAMSQAPLPTLFFEIELSPEPMTERFIAKSHNIDALEVERTVRGGGTFNVESWRHVYICNQSNLSIEDLKTIIYRSELKMRCKPRLVLIDYIGLMAGENGKRYERLSNIAEKLKVLARETNTVIIIASQVHRDDERTEIALHDAKDSGSIENSAQLVIGAWRPQIDRMRLKILKQTRMAGQPVIDCLYEGNKQSIRELNNEIH